MVTPGEQAAFRSTLRAANKGKRGRPKKPDRLNPTNVQRKRMVEPRRIQVIHHQWEPRAQLKGRELLERPPDGGSVASKGRKVGKPQKPGGAKSKSKGTSPKSLPASAKPANVKVKGNPKGTKSKGEPTVSPEGGGGPKSGLPRFEKTFGCSRCRYASKGCKTCRQPGFRPRPRKSK